MRTKDLSIFQKIEGEAQYECQELHKALAPWSISSAKVAKRCSRNFRWKYIERRDADEGVETKTDATKVGSAMHKIYEDMVEAGYAKEQAREIAVKEQELGSDALESFKTPYDGVDWFMHNFKVLVRNKVLRDGESPKLLEELVQGQRILVEHRFSLDSEFNDLPGDFFNNTGNCFLRGVIDLMLLTKDNGAIILDHKSSPQPFLKHFLSQLGAYTVAAFAMFPHLEWVQCGVHFMPIKTVKFSNLVLRKDFDKEKEKLYYFLSQSANNALEDTYKTGNHCNWCPYINTCKLQRKRKPRKKKS